MVSISVAIGLRFRHAASVVTARHRLGFAAFIGGPMFDDGVVVCPNNACTGGADMEPNRAIHALHAGVASAKGRAHSSLRWSEREQRRNREGRCTTRDRVNKHVSSSSDGFNRRNSNKADGALFRLHAK
jgi:hypothetical protein